MRVPISFCILYPHITVLFYMVHKRIIMYAEVYQDSKTELLAPIWIVVSWMNQHHWLVRFLCYIIPWDLVTKMEPNYWLELWVLLTLDTKLYYISWLRRPHWWLLGGNALFEEHCDNSGYIIEDLLCSFISLSVVILSYNF